MFVFIYFRRFFNILLHAFFFRVTDEQPHKSEGPHWHNLAEELVIVNRSFEISQYGNESEWMI